MSHTISVRAAEHLSFDQYGCKKTTTHNTNNINVCECGVCVCVYMPLKVLQSCTSIHTVQIDNPFAQKALYFYIIFL